MLSPHFFRIHLFISCSNFANLPSLLCVTERAMRSPNYGFGPFEPKACMSVTIAAHVRAYELIFYGFASDEGHFRLHASWASLMEAFH